MFLVFCKIASDALTTEASSMPCIKWWGRKKNSNLASQMERRLVEKDAAANLMCGTGWWFRHIMSLELPWDVSDFSACGTKWLNTTTFTATFGCWSHFFLTGIFPTPPFGRGSAGAGVRALAGQLPPGSLNQLTYGQLPLLVPFDEKFTANRTPAWDLARLHSPRNVLYSVECLSPWSMDAFPPHLPCLCNSKHAETQ
jgi:hypothetical protein